MKCPNCGKEISDESKFCEFCGVKIVDTDKSQSNKIFLNEDRKVWLGVCAGEGDYNAKKWGGKPEVWTIVSRIGFIAITCLYGIGLLVYIIAYYTYKRNKN